MQEKQKQKIILYLIFLALYVLVKYSVVKAESICNLTTTLIIDVFLLYANNGRCKSYMQKQKNFLFKFYENPKISGKIKYNFWDFSLYKNKQERKNFDFLRMNESEFKNLCLGLNTYQDYKFNKFPRTNNKLQFIFFEQQSLTEIQLNNILSVNYQKVVPIFIYPDYQNIYTHESKEKGYIVFYKSQMNINIFINLFCKISLTCQAPKKYLKNSILYKTYSTNNETEIGDFVEYKCIKNKTKSYWKVASSHNISCAYDGTYTEIDKDDDCLEIMCNRPIIAFSKLRLEYINNLRGYHFQNASNKYSFSFHYLSVIDLKCSKGYQFKKLKTNFIQLTCMKNHSQADFYDNYYLRNYIWECTVTSCNSIHSLANATIVQRNRTEIQGKCNKGFIQNGSKNLFYRCNDQGIDSFYKCLDSKKKAKNRKLVIIAITISVFIGIGLLTFAACFIYFYKKKRSFQTLE